jgi:hypothetical protein
MVGEIRGSIALVRRWLPFSVLPTRLRPHGSVRVSGHPSTLSALGPAGARKACRYQTVTDVRPVAFARLCVNEHILWRVRDQLDNCPHYFFEAHDRASDHGARAGRG